MDSLAGPSSVVDLTDDRDDSHSPASSVSECNSVSAGHSSNDIRYRPHDIILITDSDDDSDDDEVILINDEAPQKYTSSSRCKRTFKPKKRRLDLDELDEPEENPKEEARVVIMEDISKEGRATAAERLPIPVVMDHSIIQYFWEKMQNISVLDDLDSSQTEVDMVERAQAILMNNSELKGSLGIKYRTYEEMIKNDENMKNFQPPTFPPEFLACCSCTDGCKTNRCECRFRSYSDNHDSGLTKRRFRKQHRKYGYNNDRLEDADTTLIDSNASFNVPFLYECHGGCACKMRKCENVVVQDGMQNHLELFLTQNKGWGVRARKLIRKGEYICTYTGLICPLNTSQTREKNFQLGMHTSAYKKYVYDVDVVGLIQDAHGDKGMGDPLFWLRENRPHFESKYSERRRERIMNQDEWVTGTYAINADNCGSVARYINHRCDDGLTNVFPQMVYDIRQDQRLPRLTFFAKRDIPAGTELEYDYALRGSKDKRDAYSVNKICFCSSTKCRKQFIS